MGSLLAVVCQAWQRVGKEAVWVLVSQALVALASVLALRQLTQLLPTAEYGRAYLLINGIGFGLLVFIAPFSQAVNRFYHENQQGLSVDALLGLTWRVQIILSVGLSLGYGLVGWGAGYLNGPYAIAYGVVPIYFVLAGLQQITVGLLNTSRQRRSYAGLQIADAWLRPIVALLLGWYWRADANALLLGFTVAGVATGTVSALCLIRMGSVQPHRLPVPQFDQIKHIMRYAWPFIGLSLASWVIALSDRYLVSWFLGLEEAGQYMAGYQVGSPVFLLVGGLFSLFSQPILFQHGGHNTERAGRLLSEWGCLFVWAMVPVTVCFFLVKDWLLRWLVAPAYWDAAPILGWVGVGTLCLLIANFASNAFLLTKQPEKMIWRYACAALLNLVLNCLLIPSLGIQGAAVATFGAYACYAVLCIHGGQQELPWQLPWRTLGLVGAGLGMAGVLSVQMRTLLFGQQYDVSAFLTTLGIFGCGSLLFAATVRSVIAADMRALMR